MPSLQPTTSLGGITPAHDSIGGIDIIEAPFVAIASIAARLNTEKQTRSAIKSVLGKAAPKANQLDVSGDLVCFWTGPDQWMITAPMDTHEHLASTVAKAAGSHASVTEQSGGWAQFDVTGQDVPALFERLCAVPIRSMTKGSASRTRIEQLGCFVLHHGDRISVLGPRASAGSLHHALTTAAQSIA